MTLDAPEQICSIPGRRRGEGRGRAFPLLHRRRDCPRRGAGLSRREGDPPMEASGGREIPIVRSADGQRAKRMETR